MRKLYTGSDTEEHDSNEDNDKSFEVLAVLEEHLWKIFTEVDPLEYTNILYVRTERIMATIDIT